MPFLQVFACATRRGVCEQKMSKTKQITKKDILIVTIPLFAKYGYDKVSMRQIATTVGVKAASLYHHFPDKQTLYLEALSQAFNKYADSMAEASSLQAGPEQRLRLLIHKLCTLVHEDIDFSRLMQREIIDGDEKRLQFLADHVFGDFFQDMNTLCQTLAPSRDSHLMAVSILGLVLYHYQIRPVRSFLPGFQDSHNDPALITSHVLSLLKNGCA